MFSNNGLKTKEISNLSKIEKPLQNEQENKNKRTIVYQDFCIKDVARFFVHMLNKKLDLKHLVKQDDCASGKSFKIVSKVFAFNKIFALGNASIADVLNSLPEHNTDLVYLQEKGYLLSNKKDYFKLLLLIPNSC